MLSNRRNEEKIVANSKEIKEPTNSNSKNKIQLNITRIKNKK
jgi:hypothetical protein